MSQTVFTAKEAKNNFGRLLDEARIAPVMIKKNGRKVAFLVSAEDYEEERVTPELLKELELSAKSGRVSAEEIEKELGL